MGTTFVFEAIGTHWRITLAEELTPSVSAALEKKIFERIDEFDRAYSRFRDDSLVAEMARKEGKYTLPDDGPLLILLYERVYDITKGKVTPLIGSVMEEAGYDKQYSLLPKEVHTPLAWEDALMFDGSNLTLRNPALLDFGAAGKGYLVDLVARVIEGECYGGLIIDAGGDIIHRGANGAKLRVGLEHPLDLAKVIGVAELGEESICGSAGNRRVWGEYTHIIDPTTLTSPRDILATWVVADTTLLADMLATCLFFVSPETLIPHFAFQHIILYKDLTVIHSSDAHVEFF